MKNVLISSLAIIVATHLSCVTQKDFANKPALKTPNERHIYMKGVDIGDSLKNLCTEIDYNALLWGIQDVMKGRSPVIILIKEWEKSTACTNVNFKLFFFCFRKI